MRIEIEVAEQFITRNQLRTLVRAIEESVDGRVLKMALREFVVAIETEKDRTDPTVVIVDDEGNDLLRGNPWNANKATADDLIAKTDADFID